ncbi:M1 family aminopeptidase [soil metagenome]
MSIKLFNLKTLAVFVLLAAFFNQIALARPMNEVVQNVFQQDEKEVKKLPPVHYVRSRDYDMQNIALNLKFDWDKEQAYGTATITLASLAPNFQKVNLDAGAMIINSVMMNGKNLTFNYDEPNSNLSINLDRAYQIGEPMTFVVDYRTKGIVVANTLGFGAGGGLKFIKPTADNPNRRRQIWSQGESDYNRFWFPGYDSPNDFRTTELTATVGKGMFVVGNGKLVNRKPNSDGTETFYWKMDTPYANYLTSIVVGEYTEIKGKYLDVPVSTYLFPNEAKEGEPSVRKLPDMVKFFSEITGVKYPYPKYAQTTAEGFGGGMENISATTMTPNLVHDERELLDFDSESLQSHELAHQWFGDYVTCREWSDIWLNESFATYFEALWTEKSKGHSDFLYSDVLGNQQAYLNTWNQGSRRPVVTKYYTNADALFDTYAYPRGGAVLHMLKKHLGDALFFRAINHYLKTNANSPVQTEELRIAVEEATGQSMDWFFDQWIYKMGHPIFEVTKNYDATTKKLTLNVKQTQKIDLLNEYPQAAFFQGKMDIAVDNKIEQIWIKPQAENVFTFDAATAPKLVDFDYEGTWIKEVKFDKSTDDLIYQFRNDKDMLGRVWAMGQLSRNRRAKETSDTDKSKILAAFNQAMTSDEFWAIRRDAIQSITQGQGNPNAPNAVAANFDAATVSALTNALKDKDTRVRAAAISGLGLLRDAKYADTFIASLNDRSYGVIDAAAIALGRTKDAKAFEALAKLLEMPSWKDHLRLSGLQGLSVLGDKRALDVGFKYADKSYSPQVRTTALGVLAAAGKGDARVYPLLLENYKKGLDNNDFNVIFSGLQNFVRLADPRAQEAFDLAKDKFKDRANFLGFINQIEMQFKKALEQK